MNKIAYKIIIVLLACVCLLMLYYRFHPIGSKIIIRNTVFQLEVAATDSEKEKGLGGRSSLNVNTGMIFPYDHKDYFPFWMNGMNFPLDFLWIDGNTIVDISKNIPVMTGSNITVIRPGKPVDKIIEFNAGFADSHGILVGDTVLFKN